MKERKNLKIGVLLALFVLIIAGSILVYSKTREKPSDGTKNIKVEVIMAQGDSKTHDINTDQEYLRGALEEKNLVQGTETEMGLFIKTVDGYTVNDDKQEWWSLSKNGDSLMTGIDTSVINDGDHFEITLMEGY